MFINLLLFWTHISVTLSYRIFSALSLFRTANTTSKMPLLILSLYNLYSTPYCELMDTSCRTTSILKGNSPKQSTMWQCKHTWREHDKSKIGFTYFWWVAPGCPSQQRGHAVHAAIGRKRGWVSTSYWQQNHKPTPLCRARCQQARGALHSGSQRLPRSHWNTATREAGTGTAEFEPQHITVKNSWKNRDCSPFLLIVLLLVPCNSEKAQTQ